MKNILANSLTLVLCLELMLAPFPKTARADGDDTTQIDVTSPSGFLEQVPQQAQYLYNKDTGCARPEPQKDGTLLIRFVNWTTATAVHNPGVKSSADCKKQVQENIAAWREASSITNQADKASSTAQNSKGCDNCSVPAEKTASPACDKATADEVARVQKNDPSCSTDSQLASLGLGNSLKNAAEHPLKCAEEIITYALSSLKQQFVDAWNKSKASFTQDRQVEDALSQKARLYASLSDVQTTSAAQNSGSLEEAVRKSMAGLLTTISTLLKTQTAMEQATLAGVDFGVSTVTGLDPRHYIDLYRCSQCSDKANVLCKVIGSAGRDAVIAALTMWLGNKAFKAAGSVLFSAEKNGAEAGAEAIANHVIVKSGGEYVPVEKSAVTAFEEAAKTPEGQVANIVASSRKVAFPDDEALIKNQVNRTEIAVVGGHQGEIASAKFQQVDQTERNFPALNGKLPKDTGGTTVEEVLHGPTNVSTSVGTSVPEINKAKAAFGQLADSTGPKGTKIINEDAENSTHTTHRILDKTHIEIDTPNGVKTVKVPDSNKIDHVLTFRDGESNLLVHKVEKGVSRGGVSIAQGDEVVRTLSAKEMKSIEPLLKDKATQKKIDDALFAKAQAKADVALEREPGAVSSSVEKPKDTDYKAGPNCPTEAVTLKANGAIRP